MSNQFQYPFNPIQWQGGPHDFTGDNVLGPYTYETTQRFVYGTRFITWDGRVYKYSISGDTCYTHRLNAHWNTISSDANGIDYSVLTNAQSIGDREITLTNGSTAVAEDYLAGGIIIIVPTEGATDRDVMTRMVVGNDIAAASAECRMYLDYPVDMALTTSNYAYVMPSNYRNIRYSNNTGGTRSFAGLAAVGIDAANYNFWLQTYGPCNSAHQSRTGQTTWYRMVYARHDGSTDIHADRNECDRPVRRLHYGQQRRCQRCDQLVLDYQLLRDRGFGPFPLFGKEN